CLRRSAARAATSVELTRRRLQEPLEVKSRQGLHARDVGQVEMDRRNRHPALVDGRQVASRLRLVARLHAVDPVTLAPARLLLLELERVVVAPLAELRDARAVHV